MRPKRDSRQGGPYDDDERGRSFIDGTPNKYFEGLTTTNCSIDDLPVIRDNIKKGFFETQSKFNSWVTTIRKKIDGDDDEEQDRPTPATGFRSGYSQPQYGGRRSSDYQRRSQDQDRYDADPQVIGDDFASLQLKDQEGDNVRAFKRCFSDLYSSTTTIESASSESRPFQTITSTSIGPGRTACVLPRRSA